MKILVIGSKGFIGSHVLAYFSQKEGYECWGCGVSVDYVAKNYFTVDATNSDFNEIFESIAFDICINCSGAASVPASLTNPLRDFSLNTYNVARMLDAIRKHSPKCKFMNMSSAAVYGNPKVLPISEGNECVPVSPYGLHKHFSEQVCNSYAHFFDIKTCSLRIFSAYGPGLKKQLLWDIFVKARTENEVKLFGTGAETRDYIYIDDILTAIETIIQKGNFFAGIYNIASGVEVSVNEVATTLLEKLGYKGKLSFSGIERFGDPIKWEADISSLKLIGYKPKFEISTGIQKYVEWLKDLRLP